MYGHNNNQTLEKIHIRNRNWQSHDTLPLAISLFTCLLFLTLIIGIRVNLYFGCFKRTKFEFTLTDKR